MFLIHFEGDIMYSPLRTYIARRSLRSQIGPKQVCLTIPPHTDN